MKNKKAHVEVFNNSVDDDSECCDRRWQHGAPNGAPVFGVMVLLSGIMLFLNVIGKVPWSVWGEIWKFWPVILIFIGIQILSGVILFLLALYSFGIIIIFSLQSVGSPIVANMTFPWWIANVLAELRRIVL